MAHPQSLRYLSGFGNEHESEALQGALPVGRFSPQKVAYGLYAEQFSSTAFTMPRHKNRRTWLYRIRPSVVQGRHQLIDRRKIRTAPDSRQCIPADVFRWNALPIPQSQQDFIDGWVTMATNGDVHTQRGMGVHVYCANRDMEARYFCNADGELLIVPQQGALWVKTEMGILHAVPGDILVIPKGVKFTVALPDKLARGYICENYGEPLQLPERGPVGANGFANERDFLYPVAWYEDREEPLTLITKFAGHLYEANLDHSPLDVVAWVGNSAPYKYDLGRFNVMGSVSYDHPDPSIFTVLTSLSDIPGTANVDFVIFPPRWTVAEDTFRPPWFHRNVMSECMGLIYGVYDAKTTGFEPGGLSLHNGMSAHGPEADVFNKASREDLEPRRQDNSLAFMFESRYVLAPTEFALSCAERQSDYEACWSGLKKQFQAPSDKTSRDK
ncbi:homogentisate 1,2-dioxygenase [Pseudomaricurvus sp.]|uniref:homogentisate 1,2-dioxygenase n=1 Tax=Pseudomaricurvus sp. TaxID=2004510 RepID=UPI003F6AF802